MAIKSIMKVSETEAKNARAAGFKRKKPKKPVGTITEAKFNNYVTRYNDWAKALKEKAKIGAKIASDKKKVKDLRSKLSGL